MNIQKMGNRICDTPSWLTERMKVARSEIQFLTNDTALRRELEVLARAEFQEIRDGVRYHARTRPFRTEQIRRFGIDARIRDLFIEKVRYFCGDGYETFKDRDDVREFIDNACSSIQSTLAPGALREGDLTDSVSPVHAFCRWVASDLIAHVLATPDKIIVTKDSDLRDLIGDFVAKTKRRAGRKPKPLNAREELAYGELARDGSDENMKRLCGEYGISPQRLRQIHANLRADKRRKSARYTDLAGKA